MQNPTQYIQIVPSQMPILFVTTAALGIVC
jgi:hypothetical protein